MHALLHGVPWVHVIPALLAVIFAVFYLKTKQIYIKVIFGFLWLLLIPNTAYIFIDVERFTLHWNSVSVLTRIELIFQYVCLEIIGLVTFLLAMIPLENIMHEKHLAQKKQIIAIILFNFLIGFGMVLGRTGYTNSYVVFTQPSKVFFAVINIVMSLNLLGLVALFGIICNVIYFIFRRRLLYHARKLL